MSRVGTAAVAAVGSVVVAVHVVALTAGGIAALRVLGVVGAAVIVTTLALAHLLAYRKLVARRRER
jgi:hypothetical protein